MIILDDKSGDPLYMQIYKQIREKIISGRISEGTRLQSIRALSESLGVSKNTVKYAYGQLSSEGYIENRARSGFFAQNIDKTLLLNLKSPSSPPAHLPAHPTTSPLRDGPEKQGNRDKPGSEIRYNFQYGMLSPGDFPIKIWRRIVNQILSPASVHHMAAYPERKGEAGLREEIMKYLHASRGVSASPDRIVICPGSQFAFSRLSQLLKSHSSHMAVEDPGYDGARCVFMNHGFNLVPVGVGYHGINMDELENSPAKIIYTTPSHQFPSGNVMHIGRRLKLLEWAADRGGIIIEDDYDSELRYGGKPIPSIQSIDRAGRVIYLGTLSKSLSPALRLSYMVFPESLMEAYNALFQRYNAAVPWLGQKALEQFMNSGHWDRHLRRICLAYKKRHDALLQAINEKMGDRVVVHGRNAGLHVLLEFRNGLSEEEAVKRAEAHGVKVYPVAQFWLRQNRYQGNMILLGFSGMSKEDIVEGITILNKAWFNG